MPILSILVAILCSVILATAASGAPMLPTPLFTSETAPVLQWRSVVNRTLSSSLSSNLFSSSSDSTVFSASSGADGTGVFLVSGSSASRRRAVDGEPTWRQELSLPDGMSCGSPYLPPDNANHLYTLCGTNIIVKRWWDTGVVQFAVRIFSNSTVPFSDGVEFTSALTAPKLTQIVGLSAVYTPYGLILGSAVEGTLIIVDSRSGEFLARYEPNFAEFLPPPASPFVSFSSIKAYVPDWTADQILAVAHAISAAGGVSLISFRLSLSTLTVSGGFFEVLIEDASNDDAHSVTLSTTSQTLYVRTSDKLFGIGLTDAWSLKGDQLTASVLPIGTKVLEAANARYLMSDVISADPNSGAVQLPIIDIQAPHAGMILFLDFSLLLDQDESPWRMLVDQVDGLIIMNSQHLSYLPLNVSNAQPSVFQWTFDMFEDWTGQDAEGDQTGEMSVGKFADQSELASINSMEFLPDMQTSSSFLLIRCNTTGDVEGSETLFAFTTHASPSCNETAQGDCTMCESASFNTTARSCAYCLSSSSCLQYDPHSDLPQFGATCSDSSFTTGGMNQCSSGDDDDNDARSAMLFGGLITGLILLVLIPIGCLIHKSRSHSRARRPEESLKQSYHALSPNSSFSQMRATSPRTTTPRATVSPPAQLLEDMESKSTRHADRIFSSSSPILQEQI